MRIPSVSNPFTSARFRRDHRWTPEHLSDYVDEDLSPHSRTRLQRHVDQCPDCNRALVTLQSVLDRLHRMPRPEAGEMPDIVSAVRRRLHEPADHE
jgi:anti-sigma factor RsiW